jgi:predicted RNase H-like HicB family nuclease
MRMATYEILSAGTFYGEITGFQGAYANTKTLEACRDELREVLEGWIVLARILRQAGISRDEWEKV